MKKRIIEFIPDVDAIELELLSDILHEVREDRVESFLLLYRSKRRKSDTVLLLTILGFIVIAGIQRFYLNQILMGFVYLFTGGLCLIGTIIDLINHKDMTLEYNEKVAFELLKEVKSI